MNLNQNDKLDYRQRWKVQACIFVLFIILIYVFFLIFSITKAYEPEECRLLPSREITLSITATSRGSKILLADKQPMRCVYGYSAGCPWLQKFENFSNNQLLIQEITCKGELGEMILTKNLSTIDRKTIFYDSAFLSQYAESSKFWDSYFFRGLLFISALALFVPLFIFLFKKVKS